MNKKLLYISIFVILITLLLPFRVYCQENTNLMGNVKDKNNKENLFMAVVGFKEINKWTTCDENGNFEINKIPKGEYTLVVSSLGYKTYQIKISIPFRKENLQIFLNSENLQLKEIIVIAKESRKENTSSKIDKNAISHLQPTSFKELLELLPGNSSIDPSMGKVNIVSMRQVGSDVNTSLGTSILMDGMPLSNDANLQSIDGCYDRKINNRNNTGFGLDLRKISTDDIEKVEIVRGIPSVKYGDLNSGLIKIKRRTGKSRYRARLKASPNSKLFYLGKGYELGNKSFINVGIDYLNYKIDPCNDLSNYKRITSSVRYNKRIKGNENIFDIKASIDYTGSFDDEKEDKEINNGRKDYYKNSYNKIRSSAGIIWRKNKSSFLKRMDFNISSSYTHNKQIRDLLISQERDIPWTRVKKEGIHDGVYLPFKYQANFKSDAKPFNLFSSLNFDFQYDFKHVKQEISLGFDYKYDKNYGRGEIYDPYRPLFLASERARQYRDVPSLQRLSSYLEDKLSFIFNEYALNLNVGIRTTKLLNIASKYSISNKIFIEPRFNLIFKFPSFNFLNYNSTIGINLGYGHHKRFPVLTHLYPQKQYFDLQLLNYYHTNEAYRRIVFDTHIVDPTNYNIKEADNKKFELGFDFNFGGNSFSLTAFIEKLSSGYRDSKGYRSFTNKVYDSSSIDHANITSKPDLDDMTYKLDTALYMYNRTSNGALLEKRGIEYQLSFERIELLSTRLTVSGAWFRTRYSDSQKVLRRKNVVILGERYNYIGVYDWNNGTDRDRFNTNFRFDTQFFDSNIIFSSLLEIMWYSYSQKIKKDPRPIQYISKDGSIHNFTSDSEKDMKLKMLIMQYTDSMFEKNKMPIEMSLNFKITKKFNSNISLSMYVNRLVSYLKPIEHNGISMKRRTSPYFGMELNIKL